MELKNYFKKIIKYLILIFSLLFIFFLNLNSIFGACSISGYIFHENGSPFNGLNAQMTATCDGVTKSTNFATDGFWNLVWGGFFTGETCETVCDDNGGVYNLSAYDNSTSTYYFGEYLPNPVLTFNVDPDDYDQDFGETNDFNWTMFEVAPPTILNETPNNITYNVTDTITISANITDSDNVSTAYANVTYSNGTFIQQISLTPSGDIYSGPFTIPAVIDTYNITFWANDTGGDSTDSTDTSFFLAIDGIPPNVTNLVPIANTNFQVGETFEISADITDEISVNTTFVTIDYVNGTSINSTLTYSGTGNKYNVSFTAPTDLGRYNITFFANDSSSNINYTETTYFNVIETEPPQVFDIRPISGGTYEVGDSFEISVNVTDNLAVDIVYISILYPNTTVENLTLNNQTGDKYNISWTAPPNLGSYTVTFIANDTPSNNINTTESTFFIINDSINPYVTLLTPVNGSIHNVSSTINITSNVTDNYGINFTNISITGPNGYNSLFTMNNVGDIFDYLWALPNRIGEYIITIIGVDLAGNINNTQTSTITIQDTIAPSLSNPTPTNDSQFNISDLITLSINVSDLGYITNVSVQLVNTTGSVIDTIYLSGNSSGGLWSSGYTIPSIIGTNFSFIFNATDETPNSTLFTIFNLTFNEITPPNVTTLLPIANTYYDKNETIEISTDVTDNIAVDTVSATIDYPNGTTVNLPLTLATGNKYNSSFTTDWYLTGRYNVTFFANDTSNNINQTETTYFNVEELKVTLNTPTDTNSTLIEGDLIEFNVSTLSGVNLTNVTIYIWNSSNNTIYTNTKSLSGLSADSIWTNNFTTGNYTWNAYASNLVPLSVWAPSNFTFEVVADYIYPQVTILSPANGSLYNTSDIFLINTNVTDNKQVDSVYANITLSNGSTQIETLSFNSGLYSTNYTVPDLIGNLTITIYANDTTGNINSTEFVIVNTQDKESPNITTLLPIANTYYDKNETIEISTDVTDNIAVDTVSATIDYPNGTTVNLPLTLATGNKYNSSFTTDWNLTGRYNVTFFANDTSNNINQTETTYFNVEELKVTLNTPTDTNSTLIEGDLIEFNVSTLSGVNLTNVTIYIWNSSNNTIYTNTKSLSGLSADSIWTNNFTTGNYTWNAYASNIVPLSVWASSNFTFEVVADYIFPQVSNLTPINGSIYNVSDVITISSNITDNKGISNVYANITLPNGSTQIQTLTLTNGLYTYDYTIPNLINEFTITIFAIDLAGNVNSSESVNFIAEDPVNPEISTMTASPSAIKTNENININVVATDNVEIDSSWVNLTYPNGSTTIITLPSTFSNTGLNGIYNLTYYVNDTSGNIISGTRWFEVGSEINASINVSIDVASGLDESTDVIFQLVHPNFGDVIYSTVANGSFNVSVPDVKYDYVFLGAFNGTLNITLKKVNISENQGNSIALDKHKNLSEYIVTYGVNTDYIFNISEVLFSYGDQTVTNENNLRLLKCSGSDYNFTGRSCSGTGWVDITSLSSQNISGNYFELTTATFSGFSIIEDIEESNSGSGGSSGGGGGYAPIDEGAEESGISSGALTCSSGYSLSDDGESCIEDEPSIQDETGSENQIPEKLFDITFTIDDFVIEDISGLSGIVTYTSFGSTLTPVNYTFTLYDENENILYSYPGYIEVLTENVEIVDFEEFNSLNLSEGKYKIVYTSVYNVDVFDEFSQDFTIRKQSNLFTGILNSILNNINYIFIGLVLLIFTKFLFILLKRKKENKHIKTKTVKKLGFFKRRFIRKRPIDKMPKLANFENFKKDRKENIVKKLKQFIHRKK